VDFLASGIFMLETNIIHEGKIAVFSFAKGPDFDELDWQVGSACDYVRHDSDANVLVITSDSHCFVQPPENLIDLIDAQLTKHISEVEIPVIGVVKDNAFGIGMEVILACDIRVCARDSRFSMNHILEGFLPSNGGTQRLPRVVGQGRALDLILTGREFDSKEASEIGFVQYISDLSAIDDGINLAKTISDYAPIASKYLKEAINSGIDMTFSQGMSLEADLSVILQGTEDRAEGINSFLHGNHPTYKGK